MTTLRLPIRGSRTGIILILGLVTALFSPFAGFGATHSASASPLRSVPTVSVTVPAGGSAFLQVRAISFKPGQNLPQGPLTLADQPLPNDRVRTVLFYAMDWGYTETDLNQVALAIWWAKDGSWNTPDHAVADHLASTAAGSSALPSWNPEGRSILSAIAQGQLSLAELSLTPSADLPVAGTGTLVVRNTSDQDITAFLPYGSLFGSADGTAIVWATDVGQTPPNADPPIATSEPQATATAATSQKGGAPPTVEATPASSKAPAETATPAPEPPATTPGQGDPPVAQPTDTAPASGASVKAPPPVGGGSTETSGQKAAPEAAPANSESAAAPQQERPASATTEAPADSPNNAAPDGPLPPNDTATPTPGDNKSDEAPPPVGTAQATVDANQKDAPKPEQTVVGTLSTATPTSAPTATMTDEERKKAEEEQKAKDQAAQDEKAKANQSTPAPAPTPTDPKEGPVITVAPAAGDAGQANAIQPQTSGAAPQNNPTTGAGPSPLPAWLTLFSAMLVFGGWSMKRMSKAVPQRVEVENEQEK